MAYIAGDGLLTVRGIISGVEEFANTWAFYGVDDDGVAGDVVLAVNAMYDTIAAGAAPLWPDTTVINGARYVNLFTGAEVAVPWPSIDGDNGNDSLPAECALRVSLKTLTTNGGPFLPAFTVDNVDAVGQLTTAAQNVVHDAVQQMLDDVDALGASVGLHSPTALGVLHLTGAKVGKTYDVIRRRRNDLPEAYLSITLP